MTRFVPSVLSGLVYSAVALIYALAMGQARADWLFAALMLAVLLGLVTGPVLAGGEGAGRGRRGPAMGEAQARPASRSARP